MPPVTPADQMRATGSGRRKVALPPGRSQLDWVRNSARIIPRSPRDVSLPELRRHCNRTDAWVSIDYHVFDVSSYIEYHPGGIDILAAVAGKDATALFNKYHAWVNVHFMLKNCYVGMLDARNDDKHDGEEQEEAEDDDDDADEELDKTAETTAAVSAASHGSGTS